jgi:hypothetical protein
MESDDLISEHRQKVLDAALLTARLRRGVARFRTAAERRMVLRSAACLKMEKAKLICAELIHSRERLAGERCPTIKLTSAARS